MHTASSQPCDIPVDNRNMPNNPKLKTTKPASVLIVGFCKLARTREPNSPIENNKGSVPKPKANITSAPSNAEPVSKAVISTLYTMPQGTQPHKLPSAAACHIVSTGRKRLIKGCTRRHNHSPTDSTRAKPCQTFISVNPRAINNTLANQ